jgi:mycoredoxin
MDTITGESGVTVYSTSWCGYCVRLKHQLGAAGIDFREVDIEDDSRAADLVQRLNGGNRTVPTVVLPGGEALTNPSVQQIRSLLAVADA